MMTTGGNWHFEPLQPGRKLRESTARDFFSSDDAGGAGAALVREGIQNALDARASADPVLVRISFRIGADAPLWNNVKPWLGDAVEHYSAVPYNGIRRDDLPGFADPERCNLLVFEDFGTTGLQGDPSAAFPAEDPDEEKRNHFFHFWRAEGKSEKPPDKLGSAGLGKVVYYGASGISTVLGLTVRANDRSRRALLMGQALLKLHTTASGKSGARYQEGYWGDETKGPDGIVLPVERTAAIDRFRNTFDLLRGNEAGLSVVVPYLDGEIERREVIGAIVRNYFYTIVAGQLDVIVRLPGSDTDVTLKSETLVREARDLERGDQLTHAETAIISLADWAVRKIRNNERYEIQPSGTPKDLSKWSEQDLESFLEPLSETLAGTRDRIALRVPVNVRHRANGDVTSHFDIYLQAAADKDLRAPVFIRDGMVVPGVPTKKVRGVHSLVVVESGPLAEFLRQSENPSHTTWQQERVKKDYRFAPGTLRFITSSVREVMDRLAASDEARDETMLADLFPMPDIAERQQKIPGPNDDDWSDWQPSPPEIVIKKRLGGFRLEIGPGFQREQQRWLIQAAYDIRRGNPLKKYVPWDFAFDEAPLSVTSEGVGHLEIAHGSRKNQILIENPDPENFWLEVSGFDKSRQILVKADRVADSA